MTVTLNQAFTMWANDPGNTAFAAKSRMPVQQVLMKKYGDVALEQVTKDFAERLFRESTADHETKVKAASVLVHVLTWGASKDYCRTPEFDISVAGPDRQRGKFEDFMRKRRAMVAAAAKEALLPDAGRKQAAKPVTEEPAQPKKRKGHKGAKMKRVCKLDPATLEVLDTYDSLTEACRANGIVKLTHALSHHQRAGGFYWCMPEDVKDFRTSKGYAGRKKPEAEKPSDVHLEKSERLQISREELARARRSDGQGRLTPSPGASHRALEVFTDDELIDELRSRQWHGEIKKTLTVKL